VSVYKNPIDAWCQNQTSSHCIMKSIYKLIKTAAIVLVSALNFAQTKPISAQLVPDQTLGIENSIVTPSGVKTLIEKGAIRGNNLFHSFTEFNVNNNQQVYFYNPAGITNILTRVTGIYPSTIDGKLGVNGNANLFLINPNGIIFGSGATLDIKGSFLATTAQGIKLGETGFFSATEPSTSNLLTVNPNAFFENALRNQQATINNQGNLQVKSGKTITLYAPNIINTGQIIAPKGTIEILGNNINILPNSILDVSSNNLGGKILIGGENQDNSNLPKAQTIFIDENVNIKADAIANGNGGNITILSENNTEIRGNITAKGGQNSGNGGKIEIIGNQKLIVKDEIDTSANYGKNGTVTLQQNNITIGEDQNNLDPNNQPTIAQTNLEEIATKNNIVFNAKNDIIINKLNNDTLNLDNGNNSITLNALGNITMISMNDTIKTNGSDITINANSLTGGNIDTTSLIKGGNITINTQGDINLQNLFSQSFSDIENVGNGGNINLTSNLGNITTKDLSSSSFSTNGNAQKSGDINITANVTIHTEFISSQTHSDNENQGGGNITLKTTNGNITTGDIISKSLSNDRQKEAGKISLNSGGDLSTQNINSSSESSQGNSTSGGIVELQAIGNISTANIDSSSTANYDTGTGGNIILKSGQNITTKNLTSSTLSSNGKSDKSGVISLTSEGDINTENINTSTESFFNKSLPTGEIQISTKGYITTGNLNTKAVSFTGNTKAGKITLNTSGNIITNNINSSAISKDSQVNSGEISLITTGDITTQEIQAYSNSYSGNSISTNVNLEGANINTKDIATYSQSENGIANLAGNITINATNDIITGNLHSYTLSTQGTSKISGLIKLIAGHSIYTQNLNSTSINFLGNSGNSGEVYLSANTEIQTGSISTYSQSTFGNSAAAGNIFIQATNNINSQSLYGFSQGNNQAGTGTNVDLKTTLGNINIGEINVSSTGNNTEKSGNINLNAGGIINSTNLYSISNKDRGDIIINANQIGNIGNIDTSGSGNGGNISITGQNGMLSLNNIFINSNLNGKGTAGNITINVPDLTLNNSEIFSTTSGIGNGGNIEINTQENVNLLNQSNLITAVNKTAKGQGGEVKITAKNLLINNGSKIQVLTDGQGQSGQINLNISDEINISGLGNDGYISGLFSSSQANSQGEGGDININTKKLTISEGAVLNADTYSRFSGGNININTKQIELSKGGQLITSTFNKGNAGNIDIKSIETVLITGKGSGFFANTAPSSSGNGGNIYIDPIMMTITNNGGISVNSQGTGVGGNIFLQSDQLLLANNAFINTEIFSNQGGNINLLINDRLWFLSSSQITTTAGIANKQGYGGNININAPFILAFPTEYKNKIIANSFQGKGGNININSQSILGGIYIDISASSQLVLQGIINLNTPGIDPTAGLINLPAIPIDFSALIETNSCQVNQQNSFTVLGRIGLPSSPYDWFASDETIPDWLDTSPQSVGRKSTVYPKSSVYLEP
jgi:filamentous hemagglutinin family protein